MPRPPAVEWSRGGVPRLPVRGHRCRDGLEVPRRHAPEGRYAVRTQAYCWWDTSPGASEKRQLWYVFAGGRLISYDHFLFSLERVCSPETRFRRDAALRDLDFIVNLRGDSFRSERQRSCYSLDEYERGLAYVAAGRMEEAWALKAAGDGNVRLDDAGAVIAARPGPHCAEPVGQARDALVKSLEAGDWAVPPPAVSP